MSIRPRNLTRVAGLAALLSMTWALAARSAESPTPAMPAPTAPAAAATAADPSAADPSAALPIERLDVLDEILVRGKLLSEVIEDAEDDFFRLYNKLNKDHDYDVYCGVMALDDGSLALVRQCVPGFLVNNYFDMSGRMIGYDACAYAYTRAASGLPTVADCFATGNPSFAPIHLPPPALMAMERRDEYAANVLKIINSDHRLQQKVRGLAALYKEMEQVQGRYHSVKPAQPATPRKNRKPAGSVGPRVL